MLATDWAFDMNIVINLKKHSMTFENKELRVILSLDPVESASYTKPVQDYEEDDDIEQIQKLIAQDEDCMKPMADGQITWEKDNSCNLDSDEGIEQ